ncbi:MAG: PAS domain-containing protein [Chitinophagaceae bacterium]|nr:PAS domain-containing protein [Chitinophagaceae bacterium]
MNPQQPNIHRFFFSEADRLLLASHLLNFGVWEFEFNTSRLIWDHKMYEIYGVAEENFGYTIDDFRKRVHPEDLPGTDEAMKNIMYATTPLFAQFRIIRPDGDIRIIKGNVTCIRDIANQPVRLIGINHDITDQQRIQSKIQDQNDRLKKIAWMQSHEIRKPVANIMGLLNLYDICQSDLQHTQLIQYLKESAIELDAVIKQIIERTKATD